MNVFKKFFENFVVNFFLILFVAIYVFFFYLRLNYELKFPIDWDAAYFSTIGNAMRNGFMPYRDLFETKPIGIFILNFLSYYFTDSLLLSHLLCIFCYIMLAIFPLLFVIYYFKKTSTTKYALAIMLGILFSLYSDLKGGKLLPEIYGIFFSCTYIFFINTLFFVRKKYLSYIILGLLMALACNFKEPFFFSILSATLIFTKDFNDFIRKFIIPFIIACIISIILLLALNIFSDWFHYIIYMVFYHSMIGNHNIFYRAFFDITNIFTQLNWQFEFLGIVALLLFIFPFLKIFQKSKFEHNKISFYASKSLLLIISLYISTMAVHSSGAYFQQHNSFAIPLIYALIFYFLKNINNQTYFSKIYSGLLLLSLFTVSLLIPFETLKSPTLYDLFLTPPIKRQCEYIDTVLDRIDEKTYVYIGLLYPKDHIYGFTKHTPKGKYAIQVDVWSIKGLDDFYTSIENNVKNAKLVVFYQYYDPHLKSLIEPILAKNFTTDIPQSLKDIKRPNFNYKIFYNKNL